MGKVKIAWKPKDGVTREQVRTGKAKDMIGFQEIKCHVIFDVKMDFTHKAGFVAGRHLTEAPGSITYSTKCFRVLSVLSGSLLTSSCLSVLSVGLHPRPFPDVSGTTVASSEPIDIVASESGPSRSFPVPCGFALRVPGFCARLRVSTWFRPILLWFVSSLSSESSEIVIN